MGSPLGPVLPGIFMVNVKRSLVPKVNVYLYFCWRYVDDMIKFVKAGSVEYLLSVLKNFHPKIKFSYEIEVESNLAFVYTLFHLDGYDVYLSWYSFSPRKWKRGTFKLLAQRAFIIVVIERKIKQFRSCFCYEKQLSHIGCWENSKGKKKKR